MHSFHFMPVRCCALLETLTDIGTFVKRTFSSDRPRFPSGMCLSARENMGSHAVGRAEHTKQSNRESAIDQESI